MFPVLFLFPVIVIYPHLWYNKHKKLTQRRKRRKAGLHMTEEAKAARRAYKREWARKNRDKVKAAEERYWTKKAAEREPAPEPQAE